jgi:hypothetical protein
VILCPFLTQKIPEDIWQQTLCLIVHPGIEGDRGLHRWIGRSVKTLANGA